MMWQKKRLMIICDVFKNFAKTLQRFCKVFKNFANYHKPKKQWITVERLVACPGNLILRKVWETVKNFMNSYIALLYQKVITFTECRRRMGKYEYAKDKIWWQQQDSQKLWHWRCSKSYWLIIEQSKNWNKVWTEATFSCWWGLRSEGSKNNNNIIIYQYLYRFAWSAKNSCYKSRNCVQRKLVTKETIIYNIKVLRN